MQVIRDAKTKNLVLAASISAVLGGLSAPAMADDLADTLYQKGVLTEEEYNKLKETNDDSLGGKYDDGFKWKSKDGNFGIKLEGRVQFDYRSSDLPDSNDEFNVPRAYLGVKGDFYKQWSYELTYNFAKDRAEYAYLNYKWSDALQVRAGLFKFPYGFSQLTSSRFIDFMDRSFTEEFEPGKDEGIAIYGEPKKNVVSYALGYSNGGGGRKNAPDTTQKDVIARAAVNFAPMVNFDKGVLHLGVDWRDGAFNVAGTDFDRTATGVEGVVAYRQFKLQSEYQTINLSTDTAANPDVNVYYVDAMWLITGEQYVDSYSINGMKAIKPLKPLHSGGMGAWELGFQYADLNSDQTTAGEANIKSTTVGIKWIPETQIRLLLNWVQNDFQNPITVNGESVDKENQINARLQVYF